eukprot:CAMPEP_0119294194 /NCGR_PEP_ID=MMETSP1329-20130426/47478_1 /TAXON_ID=114041 /ORGANISM="Genus nov. species nov., Strain RCC1024" /LENGTH=66 /DNA_ID=CAMNT_0007295073 /DNA_START=177 /DNA_END=374 /DNA_ORIENTATION=+
MDAYEPMSGRRRPEAEPEPQPILEAPSNRDLLLGRKEVARVIVLHRGGDTGAGAQIEFNNAFAWGG